jgi:hypothetical protein
LSRSEVQISAGVIGKFSERRFKMPSPTPMDRRDFLKLAGAAAASGGGSPGSQTAFFVVKLSGQTRDNIRLRWLAVMIPPTHSRERSQVLALALREALGGFWGYRSG